MCRRDKIEMSRRRRTLSTIPSNNPAAWVNQLSPGSYFQWSRALLFAGWIYRLEFYPVLLVDAPGWELTAAKVLMNAGRGGGIIGENVCVDWEGVCGSFLFSSVVVFVRIFLPLFYSSFPPLYLFYILKEEGKEKIEGKSSRIEIAQNYFYSSFPFSLIS